MTRRIILLTKSKKYHNYCVAGIDANTGEWIRLVSEDATIHNAVTPQDMTYEDNTEAQVLDIVDVTLKSYNPNYYQPENYTYDSGYIWNKVGRSTMNDVLGIIHQNNDIYVFHNNEKKLPQSFFQFIHPSDRYSLKLIVLDRAEIQVKRWNPNDALSVSVCFQYNNIDYRYLKITDERFNSKFNREGQHTLNNAVFILSLADLYDRDNCHYKLIASLIPV